MTSKTVKWLLGVLAAVVIAVAAVLVITHRDTEVSTDQAFVEYVVEDFDYAKSFTTDEHQVFVYEVQATLAKPVSELDEDGLGVVGYNFIYQTADSVYIRQRNLETGSVRDTSIFGKWMGSMNIKDLDFEYGYLEALEQLREADIVLPDGDKLTLRNPTSSDWGAPLWIFGTNGSGFVYVRTDDGTVAPMNGVDSLAVAEPSTIEVVVDSTAVAE